MSEEVFKLPNREPGDKKPVAVVQHKEESVQITAIVQEDGSLLVIDLEEEQGERGFRGRVLQTREA